MLTREQLDRCCPVPGSYPLSALMHYYRVALNQELTDADVRQIVAHWHEVLNAEPPSPPSE